MAKWLVKASIELEVEADTKSEALNEAEDIIVKEIEENGYFGITEFMEFEAKKIE
jgi:hypothetical protein